MYISLRQCPGHKQKHLGPFTEVFTIINVSHKKSIYDHSAIKGVYMCYDYVLYDNVVPLV